MGYQNWCQHCRTPIHITSLKLPYACKLLVRYREKKIFKENKLLFL